MKKQTRHPEEMSAKELARATARFDRPFVLDKARAMTATERAEEGALRRGRGRPKIGKGARKISISLEQGLLRETDALARKRGVKRSELVAGFVVAGLRRKAG